MLVFCITFKAHTKKVGIHSVEASSVSLNLMVLNEMPCISVGVAHKPSYKMESNLLTIHNSTFGEQKKGKRKVILVTVFACTSFFASPRLVFSTDP